MLLGVSTLCVCGKEKENTEAESTQIIEKKKKYQAGQFSYIFNIGIHDDYYYYGENGIIVARNVSDGTVVWENIDGITDGCSVFDNDGTLYLCGGGDGRSSFMAIDKNGNTLVYIDEIHSLDYGNPWKMEYMGDYIEVTITN